MNGEKIIALIPANNESGHIQAVVASARRYLPVLVVDDGSWDATAQLAESAGAHVLRHPTNLGKGAALITGFQNCLEEGYHAVITLDADGQHDPAEIPLFLDYYSHHPVGLVIGRRDYAKMPLARRVSNTIGRWLFSDAVHQDIPDNQSGYRLISHPLMELMIGSSEKGFELEVVMIALCLKHQLGLGWVLIRTIYRDEKSHIRPMHHFRNYLRVVQKARRIMNEP
jgi:glycosyltransferase involved in cell wall biosynthesis